MKKNLHCSAYPTFIFLCIFPFILNAQLTLKPSIGLSSLPADGDSICDIPLAIDSGYLFMEPGLHEGDTIPDFQLYTLENNSMHIGDVLTDGKPVLLVGGSVTCPKFRNHLSELNDLQATYGSQIHIYIIYTVEAHPADPDISPYKGEVWELNVNDQLGIIYPEPVIYADRKDAASDMLDNLSIDVPVLLDGPCNAWWQTYALAPNPAFLIQPNGTIFKKQGWFDNGLYAMSDAIDILLQGLPTAVPEIKNSFTVINDPSLPAIQFVFSEPQINTEVMLFDAAGRMVRPALRFSGTSFILEKNDFVPGVYFYSIQERGKLTNGKLVIQ